MATWTSLPKLTSLLLILIITAFLSIQIHARESHFFSKIPNNNNNADNFDAQFPNKNEYPFTNNPDKTTTTNIPPQDDQQQQQQPNFIPQTQENSYGLYGHESGQLPPNSDAKFSDPTGDRPFTTTTNYNNDAVPYKSESDDQEYYNNYNDNSFQNRNPKKPYENSFYYNQDLYNNNNNGRQSSLFQNTRLSRDDFTSTPLYQQQKSNDFYYNTNGGGGDVGPQGMSDTRFMENGKYYYDLNREPRHSSRSGGYFGNNNNNNNPNTYEYSTGNSMGRYQKNYNEEAADFQDEPDDEFVP